LKKSKKNNCTFIILFINSKKGGEGGGKEEGKGERGKGEKEKGEGFFHKKNVPPNKKKLKMGRTSGRHKKKAVQNDISSDEGMFPVGCLVNAAFGASSKNGTVKFYPGVVNSYNIEDDTYHILFEDGDEDEAVDESKVELRSDLLFEGI